MIKLSIPVSSWEDVKPHVEFLLSQTPQNINETRSWLKNKSEIEALLEEDGAWRYIKMTIDTANKGFQESYTFFLTEIAEKLAPIENELNIKSLKFPGWTDLRKDAAYDILYKKIESQTEIYQDANVPLETKIQDKAREYGNIIGNQNIEYKGETLTIPQAAQLLKDSDEQVRKSVYQSIFEVRKKDINTLNILFDELIQLRHTVAVNAGFQNYLEYKFVALNRFDYSPQDCLDFHQSVEQHIVPLVREFQKNKAQKWGVPQMKPWNTEADAEGKPSLKPFKNGEDLLQKSKNVFKALDPFFYEVLNEMDQKGFLDLDSKKGKAPGGYNYPLYVSGYPFIFMNAAGAQRDVVTMVHEGGHAVHSVLTKDLELTEFKNLPSEVAELASMSMELLTMEKWNEFYQDDDDLNRAKREHLEDLLGVLPWIATIDAFQFWIYQNPTHSHEERNHKWIELMDTYGNPFVDYSGYEESRLFAWQKQLHLFEVPFYYIEYGFAQLGALQIYRNYLQDPEKTIKEYKAGLSLGYTQGISEIYKEAGISFDFGAENIQVLASFVKGELDKIPT